MACERAVPGLPEGLEAVALAAAPEAERLALSCEAGWNQTPADWHRLLGLGLGFGLAERGGPLVASAVLLPYDRDIAWISMVLVTARWRRRGLASLLMGRAVAEG
ncbi:MAG: GNAT family N-acetyltransferase, partial [Tistlia sp.]